MNDNYMCLIDERQLEKKKRGEAKKYM
jgi:hypothetical protein